MNAYTVTCRDTGVDCPGSFTTGSKEELIEHVQLHGRKAHMSELLAKDIEPAIKATSMV